jgi:sugar lactone lactonase YvrE
MSSCGCRGHHGVIETFATGLQMGESPRWHDGSFWMCDWLAGEVLRFDPSGARETAARVDGLPFSIDWLPDGRMLTTTAAGVRVGPDLDAYGADDRHWNEIVVDPAGRAYVNKPGSMPFEERRPGVVGVVTPEGGSRVVAEDVWFPNGMAITPDGTTLILAESHAHRLTAFTIAADGDLVDRRVWADLGDGAAPDGICLDAEGAVWYADVPNQRCVRVREGGEVLRTVRADRGCFACMLGGADGRTLYITANSWEGGRAGDGVVLTERVDVPHAGRP